MRQIQGFPARFGLFGLAALLLIQPCRAQAAAEQAAQPQASVALPASAPFPENLTSSTAGILYASSITNGGVVRALPGATRASPWIAPGAFATRSTFGVLTDERTNTLWVCSNDASSIGIPGPGTVKGAYLKAFDLNTGAGKASVALPTAPAICNDVAIADDGALYITNTAAPQILRLQPGAARMDIWLTDPRLKGGLDGIAFGPDGNLYVDTYTAGELLRIAVRNGAPGAVTKLALSHPLTHPDAIRAFKDGFLMVEGGGTLDRVTVHGDAAQIDTVAAFAGPTGVTMTGGKAWVSEGRLALLTARGALPVFYLRAVGLPEK